MLRSLLEESHTVVRLRSSHQTQVLLLSAGKEVVERPYERYSAALCADRGVREAEGPGLPHRIVARAKERSMQAGTVEKAAK